MIAMAKSEHPPKGYVLESYESLKPFPHDIVNINGKPYWDGPSRVPVDWKTLEAEGYVRGVYVRVKKKFRAVNPETGGPASGWSAYPVWHVGDGEGQFSESEIKQNAADFHPGSVLEVMETRTYWWKKV